MPNISHLFHLGGAGMNAAKTGIATAGHNISNANTEGFSRQRVQYESVCLSDQNNPESITIGQGVKTTRIERVNDHFIEEQIQKSKCKLAYYNEMDQSCQRLENVFNELSSDGINHALASFFNAFQKLSNEPENTAIRQSVVEQTQSLAQSINHTAKSLKSAQSYLDSRLQQNLQEMNENLALVAQFSTQIKAIECLKVASPNDLLDKRDDLMQKLMGKADLHAWTDEMNQFNINLESVGNILTGTHINPLAAKRTPHDESGKKDNLLDVFIENMPGGAITGKIHGGQIGAILFLRDQVIGSTLDDLNELAIKITQSVNQIHKEGFGLNNTSQVAFFSDLSESFFPAEDFSLNEKIKTDPTQIATSFHEDTPGDNGIALQIAHLQNTVFTFHEQKENPTTATMDGWYNSIVNKIASLSAENANYAEQQSDIMLQLEKLKESISGVSVDEETTQLMQFQHVFGACARMIQIADELLNTVLSLGHR
jgi:flagellar hook-associated protein 1 FlgK